MTDYSDMQQTTETIPMFPNDSGGAAEQHVHNVRSLDPRNDLGDYNRTMLEYTHRQMSTFVDLDDANGSGLSGTSSRGSQSSGNSGRSSASNTSSLPRQANGPPPTSANVTAAAARHERKQSGSRASDEAKSSGY